MTMEPIEESWQNYERQRRRLNTRLGLVVFALLPLPAILIAVGLSPLKMLLTVASLGMSIGILYPMWWRTRHNPLRASAVEARTRRIAWVCRPGGFFCGLAATLSWSVGGRAAELGGVGFGVATALLLAFSYFSDKRAGSRCKKYSKKRNNMN
jgi:O-antigen/teichoic acid export membrane protein